MDYLTINLADECPNIGSGHRHVLVVALSDRTATILEPSSGEHAVMDRESINTAAKRYHGFDELTRGHMRLPYDPETMVKRLLKNAGDNGNYDVVVRDACAVLGGKDLPRLAGEAANAAPIAYGAGTGADEPTTPAAGEKSGAFIRRLWMTGLHSPDAIVAFVHAGFPGSKAQRSDVSWNVSKLIKDGATNVPPWPSKK